MNYSNQQNPTKNGEPLSSPQVQEKSGWDKFEILSKPIASLLTALAIGLLGYWGQRTITGIAILDQNARLYTELLSKREQSESSLRKDMFTLILKDFFEEGAGARNGLVPASSTEISQKLLKLEMLALNFGDSLSLGPLFLEVSHDISKAQPTDEERMSWLVKKGAFTLRLHRLAKRVASGQLEALKAHGKSLHIEVPYNEVKVTENVKQGFYTWPEDEVKRMEISDERLAGELTMELSQLVQDNITRILTFQFSNADNEQKTIDVSLTVVTIKTDGTLDSQPAEMKFNLDYYNFPLIDNTRLSENQRFGLVLSGFDKNVIQVEGVLFPGEFSSQRDKPYLMDAIKSLDARSYKE